MWDGDGPTPPGQFFLIIQLCEESVTLTLTNPPSLTFWWNYSNFLKIISSEPLNVLMMIFKWEPFNGKYFSVERSCCIYFESLRSPHWVLLGDFLGVSVPSFQECAMWCVVTNITHDALPPSLPARYQEYSMRKRMLPQIVRMSMVMIHIHSHLLQIFLSLTLRKCAISLFLDRKFETCKKNLS